MRDHLRRPILLVVRDGHTWLPRTLKSQRRWCLGRRIHQLYDIGTRSFWSPFEADRRSVVHSLFLEEADSRLQAS